ncbi:MAG: phosphoglycerate dehydrogenase [Thermodesulfobacteriota bacterium]
MKVLVTSKSFGRFAPEAVQHVKDSGIEVVRGSKASMTAAEIAAEVPGFDALIVGNDTVDAQVLDAGDRLRLVHMHGTGLDAIDVNYATRKGILVANAPGANRNAVAELTVALILIAARSIDRHIALLAEGHWERNAGTEVSGKTLGLLGLGNIGRRLVKLLSGFEMQVLAYDPSAERPWAESHGVLLAEEVDHVFGKADFLVLALPLTKETEKIVDARRIGLMKRSAYIVNTARGGLVDEEALCRAVTEKRIAGAALDAFEQEPLPANSPLRRAGITLTPHLAATSLEAAANVSMIVARNVVDVLINGKTRCAVNTGAAAGSPHRKGFYGKAGFTKLLTKEILN